MKIGRNLGELAAEIQRQQTTKRDFVASTKTIEVEAAEGGLSLHLGDKGTFPVNPVAHGQIAEHTGIPQRYYDKMRIEAPALLANNVQTWFAKHPAVRMNRVLDDRLRAFLSDRFQPFDNYDFFAAVMPILSRRNLDVTGEITDKKLYLKAVDHQLIRDVPVGHRMGDGSHKIFDTFAPAIILSNSEIGFGRLVIETGVYTRACTNLTLFASGGFKRTHVGARHDLTENFAVEELDKILSGEAKKKTLEALWLQARDVMEAAFDKDTLTRRVEQIEATAKNQIPADKLTGIVEVVREKLNFNEAEGKDIFAHLIAGGNLSQYGLSAAITRTAQDAADYDRATELEYAGGKILELPRNEWEKLAA